MKKFLLLVFLFFLVGCGKDVVSMEEYDNVVKELEDLRNDYSELEEQYDELLNEFKKSKDNSKNSNVSKTSKYEYDDWIMNLSFSKNELDYSFDINISMFGKEKWEIAGISSYLSILCSNLDKEWKEQGIKTNYTIVSDGLVISNIMSIDETGIIDGFSWTMENIGNHEYDENIIKGYTNKIETDIIKFWEN